jgi:steroid 5-alpha reductase family enzyme
MSVLFLSAGLLAAAAAVAMAAAWWISERTGRSGWADTIWSFAVGALGSLAALLPVTDEALSPRAFLVALMAAFWSLRLGLHIARRTATGPEDARYAWLRRQWGENASSRLFWFLQIQAAAAFLLAGCIGLAARRPGPLDAGDVLGVGLMMLAIAGEGLADRQLRHFKSDPANHGRVCDTGLWAVSRHPNYFFEWLGWCA